MMVTTGLVRQRSNLADSRQWGQAYRRNRGTPFFAPLKGALNVLWLRSAVTMSRTVYSVAPKVFESSLVARRFGQRSRRSVNGGLLESRRRSDLTRPSAQE